MHLETVIIHSSLKKYVFTTPRGRENCTHKMYVLKPLIKSMVELHTFKHAQERILLDKLWISHYVLTVVWNFTCKHYGILIGC